jgi:hypothetical protein
MTGATKNRDIEVEKQSAVVRAAARDIERCSKDFSNHPLELKPHLNCLERLKPSKVYRSNGNPSRINDDQRDLGACVRSSRPDNVLNVGLSDHSIGYAE